MDGFIVVVGGFTIQKKNIYYNMNAYWFVVLSYANIMNYNYKRWNIRSWSWIWWNVEWNKTRWKNREIFMKQKQQIGFDFYITISLAMFLVFTENWILQNCYMKFNKSQIFNVFIVVVIQIEIFWTDIIHIDMNIIL